jgi:hypothetical protein
MIITNGRSFTIAFQPLVLQFYDQGRLMGLGTPGDSEGMPEGQIVRVIVADHGHQK